MKSIARFIYCEKILFTLVLVLFFNLAHRSAFADNVDQVCNVGGQKVWYLAIGKDVFALPYDQFFDKTGGPLVDNLDQKSALAPPNPKDPSGCKGNPQQVTRFAVLNSPNIEPESYVGPMPRSIYKLEMYSYPNKNLPGPNFDPVISALADAAIACKREPILEKWNDGTILCTNTIGQLNPDLNSGPYPVGIAWEFIVSGNLYRTPLGQNLVESEFANVIDVNYLLTPNIFIHYEWLPPKSADDINPQYLIGLDKLFLEKLLSYRVADYKWP